MDGVAPRCPQAEPDRGDGERLHAIHGQLWGPKPPISAMSSYTTRHFAVAHGAAWASQWRRDLHRRRPFQRRAVLFERRPIHHWRSRLQFYELTPTWPSEFVASVNGDATAGGFAVDGLLHATDRHHHGSANAHLADLVVSLRSSQSSSSSTRVRDQARVVDYSFSFPDDPCMRRRWPRSPRHCLPVEIRTAAGPSSARAGSVQRRPIRHGIACAAMPAG